MNAALEVVRTPRGVAPVFVAVEPRYVTASVAGQIFGGVSRQTVARWITQGMPAVRKGRKTLIPVAQATAWLDAHLTT